MCSSTAHRDDRQAMERQTAIGIPTGIRTARQQLVATALSPSPPHVILASSPSFSGYHGTPCIWSRDRKELLIHLPVTKNTGLKKSGFWSKEDST